MTISQFVQVNEYLADCKMAAEAWTAIKTIHIASNEVEVLGDWAHP